MTESVLKIELVGSMKKDVKNEQHSTPFVVSCVTLVNSENKWKGIGI